MRNFLFLIMLLFLIAPAAFGAVADDAPLQLMPVPKQNTQPQPPPSQLPQLQSQLQSQGGQGMRQDAPAELLDIYGVVPTKTPVPYLYIGAGLVALILLAAFLLWFKKRKKVEKEIIIPPWEQALQALAEARTLQQKGFGRQYMERASHILRRYIEQRFAIKSTRQTTSEFLTNLARSEGRELVGFRDELQGCLEQADLAKFAHKSQGEDSIKAVETAVTGFVQATRPIASDKNEKADKKSRNGKSGKEATK